MRLALLLPLCLLLASCGSGSTSSADRTKQLARSEAQRLVTTLDRIEQRTGQGRCSAARANLRSFAAQVDSLPAKRDAALVARLREGAANLDARLSADCTTSTQATTTDTTTTDTTTDTTTTDTTTTPTTSTSTTPTVPTTTRTTPTTTTNRGGSGGGRTATAPGAVAPSGGAQAPNGGGN